MSDSSKNEEFDPHMEFDPITATYDGSTIWHCYGHPRHIVITRPGESPRDVVTRERRHEDK